MRRASAPESSNEEKPTLYIVLIIKCLYLKARFFLLMGSVRSLSGVFGRTLGGMIETLEGVGEGGGEQEGEEERKSSTSPLEAKLYDNHIAQRRIEL